jgi:excisionase family DNA binding protein
MLLAARAAARELGIGRDRFYELLRTGAVRSVAVGNRRLVPRSELQAWIERELGGEEYVENGTGKDEAPDLTAAESRA